MSGCPEIGPAGLAVAANVERLRKVRGLTLRGLSARMAEAGRPILPACLSRMAHGERRVDADDLVALAEVLEVDPAALLLPDVPIEIKVGAVAG